MERELLKLFITYGRIVETVKVSKYDKALLYELEVRSIGEKIGDRKAINTLKNNIDQKKVNQLISHEQKVGQTQKKFYERHHFNNIPHEVIVVFDTLQARND